MNFTNDLNLLASSNIIGYDTYSQTMNSLNPTGYYRNPYGTGNFNTGLRQDTFVNSSKAVKTGILGAIGLAIGSKIVSFFKTETKQACKNAKNGIKNRAKHGAKSKKLLSKIPKGFKIGAISALAGAVAIEAAKTAYNIYQVRKQVNLPEEYTYVQENQNSPQNTDSPTPQA